MTAFRCFTPAARCFLSSPIRLLSAFRQVTAVRSRPMESSFFARAASFLALGSKIGISTRSKPVFLSRSNKAGNSGVVQSPVQSSMFIPYFIAISLCEGKKGESRRRRAGLQELVFGRFPGFGLEAELAGRGARLPLEGDAHVLGMVEARERRDALQRMLGLREQLLHALDAEADEVLVGRASRRLAVAALHDPARERDDAEQVADRCAVTG